MFNVSNTIQESSLDRFTRCMYLGLSLTMACQAARAQGTEHSQESLKFLSRGACCLQVYMLIEQFRVLSQCHRAVMP